MKRSADTYQLLSQKQTQLKAEVPVVSVVPTSDVPAPFTSHDREKAALILLGIQLQLSGKPS